MLVSLLFFVLVGCVPVSPGPKAEEIHNSTYLAHRWVEEEWSVSEVEELAHQLAEARIGTVFVHVGPLDGDGLISPDRYPQLEEFLKDLSIYAPHVETHAWIGQIEKRGGGILDVTDPTTRAHIVQTAQEMIDYGFDGIHLNIEPVATEDDSFSTLIQEVKLSIEDHTLSMALIPVEPVHGIHDISKLWRSGDGMFLNPEEYATLTEYLDEVMIMAYDTGLKEPLFYTTFVAMATQRMLSVTDDNTKVYMGVPTYEDQRSNFNPDVENITTGTLGVLQGLKNTPDASAFRGIGLYAHWTTDDAEWADFAELMMPAL